MIRGMFTQRYPIVLTLLLVAPAAQAGLDDWFKEKLKPIGASQGLDADTVAAGLREALEQGTQRAVRSLGRENGFWAHPQLRIPVPPPLQKLDRALRRIGQGKLADDFALSLNRAAEQATPAARDIFFSAIRRMSIHDVYDVLNGAPDAATTYFRHRTESRLHEAFRPVVTRSIEAVGVTARYKRLIKKTEPLGIVDTRALDLDDYVTRKAIDALFRLVAEEETRIRQNPVARTTELLREVFK